ncbi:3'-5' exonuclease [Marinospirillum sp. MEB164]|uniref:DNA-directed DNA polymerase n=1 Tax=Marinospirillum alkalitolerans TaxID=3123374 RepID=A0ABW8Q1A8_9GAMM
MPKYQRLLGLWLILTGLSFFIGLALALALDTRLSEDWLLRVTLWGSLMAPSLICLLLGWWLEWRLFGPLRRLGVLFSRWSAHPDAPTDYPPEGWLSSLQEDIQRIRLGWQQDRVALKTAHFEGAKQAARIKFELEAVIQVLQVPLLLYDQHQRLLLFNPAAEAFFQQQAGLGLGRQLKELLPASSLADALHHLPKDGSARQLLIPHQQRWYLCDVRRVLASRGEVLITLEDATEQQDEQRWRQPLASLLPALRGHAANLATAAEVFMHDSANQDLKPELITRLQQGIHQDSQALSQCIQELGQVFEKLYLHQGRLRDTWSNDLWAALCPSLKEQGIQLTPIGIPLWLKADTPSLLALLHQLMRLLHASDLSRSADYEVEMQLGNQRVYLDLIWQGEALSLDQLNRWAEVTLHDDPLAPRLGDLLRRHSSDWWSLQDTQRAGHARLRLPLPSASRVYPPSQISPPRPEFHDFSIADLPAPQANLAACPLNQLNLLVFDTETTGLDLRGQDRVISLGACRILNGRLLAQESFDQKINPERPIPASSTQIHGLTDADVAQSPPMAVVLPRFMDYIGDAVLVAHNAAFDLLALETAATALHLQIQRPVLDTLLLSRALDPDQEQHSLDALAERYGLRFPPGTRHTALGDARVTAELLLLFLPRLEARGIITLAQALALQNSVQQQVAP